MYVCKTVQGRGSRHPRGAITRAWHRTSQWLMRRPKNVERKFGEWENVFVLLNSDFLTDIMLKTLMTVRNTAFLPQAMVILMCTYCLLLVLSRRLHCFRSCLAWNFIHQALGIDWPVSEAPDKVWSTSGLVTLAHFSICCTKLKNMK